MNRAPELDRPQTAGWYRGQSGRRDALLVAAGLLVWFAIAAWARPLMLPDEGRYVGVAWEMLRSGDWLTPTLDGLPYFHKPPLFYWITAASLATFGMNEWAARAAPILGAWLGALSIHWFLRRWAGDRSARLALFALAVQPLFFLGAQFANLDMLVAGCICASIVLLAHCALSFEQGQPFGAALPAAYAMAGLGLLAKGLIGVVIPLLVLVSWLALLRRWRSLRALVSVPGMALLMLVAAPWFLLMQWRQPGFADYFFIVQHVKRFAGSGFNNVQPIWFYPLLLLVFSLPWLAWLQRPFRLHHLVDGERGPVRLLMVVWLIVVVAFFSLPRSKLIGYVLPAVPPLAVLAAEGLASIGAPSRRQWAWWWSSGVATAAASLLAVAIVATHTTRTSRDLAKALEAERAAGDPVFMLNRYYYDVAFYARLSQPVYVVDEWRSPQIASRDDWRKELADAARFGNGPTSLVETLALPAALCAHTVSWVIGPRSSAASYAPLARARSVSSNADSTLWKIDVPASSVGTAACALGHASPEP